MSTSGLLALIRPDWRSLSAVGLAFVLAAPSAAWAQDDDEIDSVSVPVVQALPGGDSERLNGALVRLGRDPRDLSALIEAGNAALGMGDADAAMGFFLRADSLAPGNARVKAGIASAHVRREDPFTAIPLFAEAEKLGRLDAATQLDRGLAYDLVGDNASAQRYYRAVMALGPNDEATRRLALSLAIAGDRSGLETTLSPLLQRQDKAAWRTRAFGLAVLGKPDEAEAIAKSTLTPDLAVAMAAYLRYMPKLTAAQQAAAGNLGRFPRAADIGRDDPRVALYAKPRTAVAALVPPPAAASRTPSRRQSAPVRVAEREDPRRIPRGRDRVPVKPAPTGSDAAPARIVAAPPPEVQPSRTAPTLAAPVTSAAAAPTPVARPAATLVQPPLAGPSTPAFSVPPASVTPAIATPVAETTLAARASVTPSSAVVAAPPLAELPAQASVAAPAPLPVAAAPVAITPGPVPGPGFDLANPVAPVPTAPRRGSLEEVFADLAPPSREAVPQAGAVDIRAIAARPAARLTGQKEPVVTRGGTAAGKPAAPAKPTPPSHPSRIWVQLATGRDKAALGFDWRKLVREDAEVFKGRKPFTSAFGQSTRLITGPFESQAQATAFVSQLKKAGVNGAYVWTSPAGQVVDALAAR